MLKILQILLHKDYKFMFHQLKKKIKYSFIR